MIPAILMSDDHAYLMSPEFLEFICDLLNQCAGFGYGSSWRLATGNPGVVPTQAIQFGRFAYFYIRDTVTELMYNIIPGSLFYRRST